MAGVVLTDDDFSTLALDAQLSGRAPPVRDNTTTYGVDPDATAITGAGSSTIKFNVIGATFKLNASRENTGIQFIVNDGGVNEHICLFLRDSQTTPAQRYGFWVRFNTRAAIPYFRTAIVDNYSLTQIGSDVPWTFASNGINKFGFEAADSNFRVIVNDVAAHTFTHTSWPPNGARTRCGVNFSSAAPSVCRGMRFTIYDSIADAPASASYPIVRFG